MAQQKTTYPELQDIREDLDSLKSNVVELTKHIGKDGADQTHELKKVLESRWSKMQTSGREQYKNIERRVKAKPGQSMAIAFAAGLAASLLLRRR